MRLAAVIALAVVFGAPASATSGSGVYGKVIRTPVTPVCVAERPCWKPASGVTLEFVRRGVRTTRVVTAKDGTYRVGLPAGLYTVRLPGRDAFIPRLRPTTARVVARIWSRVNFSIDTGIRVGR